MIIGSKLIFYENLPSTNTHAAGLLRKGNIQEGTIIYTNYQSAGKGQMGNRWESEDGKNLLISIILFPTMILPAEQFFISMTISLGINDFLKRQIAGSSIKWPNDIYVDNDKIAGILIENSIMGDTIESTIAGIGLNINQNKFLSDVPNPISLRMMTGKHYNLTSCLNQLIADLDKRYKQLLSGRYDQLRNEYVSQLYRVNAWHNYKDINGVFTGRIKSVTDLGKLQVEDQKGRIKEFSFKDVDFIP